MNPIKKVEESLIDLPEQIMLQELKILGFSNNLSTMTAEIQKMESAIMHKITNSKIMENDVPKKEFSNTQARESELSNRLRTDPEYKKAKESKSFSQAQLEKSRIEFNFLKNKFSAAKYLTTLYSSRDEGSKK